MTKTICSQCKNEIVFTDRFCPNCGASIELPQVEMSNKGSTMCWFCEKYSAENEWAVKVELAANPKEYRVGRDGMEVPTPSGIPLMAGEKRIVKYDVKTVLVPRCSRCASFSGFVKKWSYIGAGASIFLALIFEWSFSYFFQITNACFASIIPLFVLSVVIVIQMTKWERHRLHLPDKVNVHSAHAKQHPDVLELMEHGWQIGLPKGYEPRAF